MTGKVLIVDHNQAFAAQLKKALEAKGLTVELRGDPLSGNAAVGSFAPDLLVLELALPAGGGKVVYRATRRNARSAELPIIVLAAPDAHEDVWEELDADPHPRSLVLRRAPELRALIPVVERLLAAPA